MNTHEIRNKIKRGEVPTWPEAAHLVDELERLEIALAETERKWRENK